MTALHSLAALLSGMLGAGALLGLATVVCPRRLNLRVAALAAIPLTAALLYGPLIGVAVAMGISAAATVYGIGEALLHARRERLKREAEVRGLIVRLASARVVTMGGRR